MVSAATPAGATKATSAKTITAAILLYAQSCIPFLSVILSMICLFLRGPRPGPRTSACKTKNLCNRRRHFPRRIKKRQFARRRTHFVTYRLHSQFHLQLGSRCCMFALDARQRDHLLERRRPRRRGSFPHLQSAAIYRYRHTGSRPRHLRRKPDRVVKPFHVVPIDVESREKPLRL